MQQSIRTERRAARRQQRSESPILKWKFRPLRNPFLPLEIASDERIDQLHQASMHILEDVGIDFLDGEALSIWAKAGAKVDHARQHVWIDHGLLMETVSKSPPSFTWRARNPERNVYIGGDHIALAPNSGMAYASNLDARSEEHTSELQSPT